MQVSHAASACHLGKVLEWKKENGGIPSNFLFHPLGFTRTLSGPSAMVFDEMPVRAGVITGASGRHAASIGYECPDSDRLNKYRESHGGALKLEARLHLLLHIHCESVEWRELRGGKT
jgi:hypothetical protein